MQNPIPDANGSFQHTLDGVSDALPWILPHYYAVNAVRQPKQVLVGWSADPSGENRPHKALNPDYSVVETIGYWKRNYFVASTQEFRSWSEAESEAKQLFVTTPIRFLMIQGQPTSENRVVRITGDWPSDWHFGQVRDLGVFFCYLVSITESRGDTQLARKVKRSLSPAWPPTELILSYQRAFRSARAELADTLSERDKALVETALTVIDIWLKG